jgi:hypothetical protein
MPTTDSRRLFALPEHHLNQKNRLLLGELPDFSYCTQETKQKLLG